MLPLLLIAAICTAAWHAPRAFNWLDDRLDGIDRAERERLVREAMDTPLDSQRVEPAVAERRERAAWLLDEARRRDEAVATLLTRRARHFAWTSRKEGQA